MMTSILRIAVAVAAISVGAPACGSGGAGSDAAAHLALRAAVKRAACLPAHPPSRPTAGRSCSCAAMAAVSVLTPALAARPGRRLGQGDTGLSRRYRGPPFTSSWTERCRQSHRPSLSAADCRRPDGPASGRDPAATRRMHRDRIRRLGEEAARAGTASPMGSVDAQLPQAAGGRVRMIADYPLAHDVEGRPNST